MNISKRLVESVTALRRSYTSDIFFSTRVKIIACLTGCIGVIALMFLVAIEYVKTTMLKAMVESLQTALTTGSPNPTTVLNANREVDVVMVVTVLLILLFGVLVGLLLTRLALVPVGQAYTMQKRFISGIAHELRTPLSLLRVNNELARFGEQAGSAHALLFDENIADIDRINEMLNNLLLFDRMASLPSLHFDYVNLNNILHTITAKLQSLADQKKVSFNIADSAIPTIMGNAPALEQVFFNILKNAIMYTTSGGTVTFEYCGVTNNMATVAISDTGVGIPEKNLRHIFEPFYRTEKTGKLAGIGLAVVYEIIRVHKGKIEVESVEGQGTTFLISLPLKQTEQTIHGLLGASASKILFNFSDSSRS